MDINHLLAALKTNPFVLAPMAGITDHAFRSFMRELGCGPVVTELVSAAGIRYKSEQTMKLMSFDETQHPIGIQLFGEDPDIMAQAAKVAAERGVDFVDVNFGCPVPKVTRKGAGSAMLKDLPSMQKLLSAMVKSVSIPITIKIRTGWDFQTRNADEVARIAYNEGVAWVAIHGRTRAQNYEGQADWDYIAEIKSKAKIPILGNGDILTPEQAVLRIKQTGVDGVLIGRGALKNPFIFKDALALWRGEASTPDSQRDYAQLFKSLVRQITAHCDDHITQIQLKKFAAWFATGYPGAAQFRKIIFQSKSTEDVLTMATQFFSRIPFEKSFKKGFEKVTEKNFLMGGHG